MASTFKEIIDNQEGPLQNEITKLLEEKVQQQKENDRLKCEIKTANEKMIEHQKQAGRENSELQQTLEIAWENLNAINKELFDNFDGASFSQSDTLAKIVRIKGDNVQFHITLREKENQISCLCQEIDSLKLTAQQLQATCNELIEENESLKSKPQKVIEIDVLNTMSTQISPTAIDDLKNQLQDHFEYDNTKFILNNVKNSSSIRGPCLVFCLTMSSVGVDVLKAMKGLSVTQLQDIAIVIFHHKMEHNLPTLHSEFKLTGQEYKQLGAIIDLAMYSDRGIYDCAMNNIGLKKLEKFLKRFEH